MRGSLSVACSLWRSGFLEELQDELSDISSPMVGYGRRWMAEAAISKFKALFGEHLLSRKPRWINSKLRIKAFIYNVLLKAVTTEETGPKTERGKSNHRN
jgi:hypothetical protein